MNNDSQISEIDTDVLPAETLDSLIAQHGSRLYYRRFGEAVVVVKPWSKAQYRAMQAEAEREQAKADKKQLHLESYEVGEKWVRPTVIHPSPTAFAALTEEFPGAVDVLMQDLGALARGDEIRFLRRLGAAARAGAATQG